jgi:hypothetical protein
MKSPMNYELLDLCAGNALGSILSVYLLPFKKAVAIDKSPRKRNYGSVRRFEYVDLDIYSDKVFDYISNNTVILAIHPCARLAERVVEIYKKSPAEHLILMPCCHGKVSMDIPQVLRIELGRYLVWCWYLSILAGGDLRVDKNCLSPKNGIIIAHKQEGWK